MSICFVFICLSVYIPALIELGGCLCAAFRSFLMPQVHAQVCWAPWTGAEMDTVLLLMHGSSSVQDIWHLQAHCWLSGASYSCQIQTVSCWLGPSSRRTNLVFMIASYYYFRYKLYLICVFFIFFGAECFHMISCAISNSQQNTCYACWDNLLPSTDPLSSPSYLQPLQWNEDLITWLPSCVVSDLHGLHFREVYIICFGLGFRSLS